MKALRICILEDDPERTNAFRDSLAPWAFDLVILDSAPDMIEWLCTGLSRTALICLDHDLGPSRLRDETHFEPGSGRDVADWLAARPARAEEHNRSERRRVVNGRKRTAGRPRRVPRC